MRRRMVMPSSITPILFPARRATVLLAVALCVSVTACGDAEQSRGASLAIDTLPGGAVRTLSMAPSDSGGWALELLHEIQPPEGDSAELLQPSDIAITEDGTVLVAEGGSAHVKVFEPDGRYLRTIGRSGEGPGEFRDAWITTRGDTLFVQDPQVARGSSFLISTGEFITSRHTACCYWSPIAVDGSGRAVVPAMSAETDSAKGPSTSFVRSPFSSGVSDTVQVPYRASSERDAVWEVRDGDVTRFTVTVPLQPRDVQRADPQGGFVTAWTGEYLLRVSSDGRDTVALYGRPFTAAAVSAAEKQELVETRIRGMTSASGPGNVPEAVLRAAFKPDQIPNVRPPFETFHIDPAGRTWVRRSHADTSLVEFDLFSAERVWLDVVRGAGDQWPSTPWASIAWGRDRVAVPGEDAEGRPVVRVFAIVQR